MPRRVAHQHTARQRFRLQSKRVHLTYKGHLPFQELYNHLLAKHRAKVPDGTFLWYSFVHEIGTNTPDTPYDHTHVALCYSHQLDIENQRYFDFNEVHPNISPIKTDLHAWNTWEYHQKAPVGQRFCSQQGPRRVFIGSQLRHQIEQASSLFEACELAGVAINSVAGVQALRKDYLEASREFLHRRSNPKWKLPIRTDFKNLYFFGGTGIGKTEFAIAHFERPLIVSEFDNIRDYNDRLYDGIIFDDMSFTQLSRESTLHLLDWNHPRQIRCRNFNAKIPPRTKKIFTSNFLPVDIFRPGALDDPAIKRRAPELLNLGDLPLYDGPPCDPDITEAPVQDKENIGPVPNFFGGGAGAVRQRTGSRVRDRAQSHQDEAEEVSQEGLPAYEAREAEALREEAEARVRRGGGTFRSFLDGLDQFLDDDDAVLRYLNDDAVAGLPFEAALPVSEQPIIGRDDLSLQDILDQCDFTLDN